MPLQVSAAHSSRVTKPRSHNSLLKRSASSPFASLSRRKPVQRSRSKPEHPASDDEDLFGDQLEDHRSVADLTTDLSLRDVAQIMKHICGHMFDAIPEKGGFNSVRIAEVLNFRNILPPTVTVAHVHALMRNPTVAEKEIAELSRKGILRKILIPGRGTGGSSVAECLVLRDDLETIVMDAVQHGLDQHVADEFLMYLHAYPVALSLPGTTFSSISLTALKRAGFLTSSAPTLHHTNSFSHSLSTNPRTSLSSIARAPSGSIATTGGPNVIHEAGGGGHASGLRPSPSTSDSSTALQISLPNTGPYLRLLIAARSHLVSLLQKSRFKEMPLDMLRERWDGGIAANDEATKAKRYRGEWKGVLPARSRKWREFWGLRFDWVLDEAVGSGLVEGFETGSVGKGVRCV